MMIFKKAIPRRTFLRGIGTTLALPLLDGMVPAFAGALDSASKAPVRVSYVLHVVFEDVLNVQAGPQEANPIALHQPEQVPAGPINAGHALQINRDLSAWLVRAGSPPAVFELRHKCPGQSSFHQQD